MMLDVWRLRFGTSRVGIRELYNWTQGGDTNDWLYVAQLLHCAGMLQRIELFAVNGVFYQLKE